MFLTKIIHYDKLNTVVKERARNAKTNEKQHFKNFFILAPSFLL